MANSVDKGSAKKPWYSFPLLWMMIAIPFSAVIMGVVMIWLAVDTDDGLVADDYYKRGLEINRVLSRDRRAAELELSASIHFDSNSRVINLKFDRGLLETYPKSLQLHLQHATRENSDIVLSLDHGIADQYIGHIKQPISKGVWYFKLSDADWKLGARSHVTENNLIELSANSSM